MECSVTSDTILSCGKKPKFHYTTTDEVESILKLLPVGKASGPGGISNRTIRKLAVEISLPVCSFFNRSLHNCEVPECFKDANVSPVFKGGDPTTVSNHRPISLLSNLDKSYERPVFK